MNETLKKLSITLILLSAICIATLANGAGRLGGPVWGVEQVNSYDSRLFDELFTGGWARVVVDGDGDTDLDLYIYDRWGTLVAYDNDYTDTCIVEWFVPRGQYYRIEVRNLGGVYNEFQIATN